MKCGNNCKPDADGKRWYSYDENHGAPCPLCCLHATRYDFPDPNHQNHHLHLYCADWGCGTKLDESVPVHSTPKSSPASPVEDKCYCEGSFHCSKCGCDTGCSCSSPQATGGEVVITEELLKDVAREADLDQLALVLFHECRHQPESGKGIKKIRDTFSRLIKEGEEKMLERCEEAVKKVADEYGAFEVADKDDGIEQEGELFQPMADILNRLETIRSLRGEE